VRPARRRPSDPDKPADVKGTSDVAPSDVATAIKYCRIAAFVAPRALQLGRAYAAMRQMREAIAAWRKAADKGSSSAMVELGVLYRHRLGYRARRGAGAQTVRARGASRQSARCHQSRGARWRQHVVRSCAGAELLAKSRRDQCRGAVPARLVCWRTGTGGAKGRVPARAACSRKAAAQNHAGALERMGAFTRKAAAGRRIQAAAKAYYERPQRSAMKTPRRRWSAAMPLAIKDKRGNLVTNLCF
jgi:TPR repeat protein